MAPFYAVCPACNAVVCTVDCRLVTSGSHDNCFNSAAFKCPIPDLEQKIKNRKIDCPNCGSVVQNGNPQDAEFYGRANMSQGLPRPRAHSELHQSRPRTFNNRHASVRSIPGGIDDAYSPSMSSFYGNTSSPMETNLGNSFDTGPQDIPMTGNASYEDRMPSQYSSYSRSPYARNTGDLSTGLPRNTGSLSTGLPMSRQPSRQGVASSQGFQSPSAFSSAYNDDARAPGPELFGEPSHNGNIGFDTRGGSTVYPPATPQVYRTPAALSMSDTVSTSKSRRDRGQRDGSFSSGPDPTTPLSEAGQFGSPDIPFPTANMSMLTMGFGSFGNESGAMEGYGGMTDMEDIDRGHGGMVQSPTSNRRGQTGSGKKKFRCEFPRCTRTAPFSTRNDLDRHKMSVHKIAAENQKVYICQGRSCVASGKNREWPRKDNFKNHCKTSHQNEDPDELVKRSERVKSSTSMALSGVQDPDATGFNPTDEDDFDGFDQDDIDTERKPSDLTISIPTGPGVRSPSIDVTPAAPEFEPPFRIPKKQDLTHLSPISTTPPGNVFPVSSHRHQSVSLSSKDTSRPRLQHNRAFSVGSSGVMARSRSQPGPKEKPESMFGPPLPSLSRTDIERELRSKNVDPTVIRSVLGKRSSFDAGLDRPTDVSRFTCSHCPKQFPRNCDLRKHEERHKRRWGCTNTDCNKRFGSKNDWKRHENLVHFQEELWVCGEDDPKSLTPSRRCIFTCKLPQEFHHHLIEVHGFDKDSDKDKILRRETERRVGRRWAGTMWCGFCDDVIDLKQRDLKQWDERFDHIDAHFKAGYDIDNWYPPDKDQPKKMLSASKPVGLGITGDESDSSSDDSEPESSGIKRGSLNIPIDPVLLGQSSSSRETDRWRPKKRVALKADRWSCCQCKNGVMNLRLEDVCWACQHSMIDCKNCEHLLPEFGDSEAVPRSEEAIGNNMEVEIGAGLNPLL